ncbi:hypothetical protein DUI87_03121 [Hirundo rustica rustica]|uniref:RNase H type-1 domain-containing protein n=1 Tax=Hirundo rustica rustica TaxID=333673 RepID=A0A3M0L2I2_HIRRU|nr:hypothetical protein DUI87_03121 [Hirundo rustica rustica]
MPELELRTTTAKNPAEFLFGEASEGLTHNCAEIIELQTKIREDLEEEKLEEGEKWFVDGSAQVLEGKRKSGYAVIDGKTGKVVESGPLSASWSAQACELYAVLQALKGLKGRGIFSHLLLRDINDRYLRETKKCPRCVNYTIHLGVICNSADGVLDPFVYAIDEDTK